MHQWLLERECTIDSPCNVPVASFPGSPSFRAIIPCTTFDPTERKASPFPPLSFRQVKGHMWNCFAEKGELRKEATVWYTYEYIYIMVVASGPAGLVLAGPVFTFVFKIGHAQTINNHWRRQQPIIHN